MQLSHSSAQSPLVPSRHEPSRRQLQSQMRARPHQPKPPLSSRFPPARMIMRGSISRKPELIARGGPEHFLAPRKLSSDEEPTLLHCSRIRSAWSAIRKFSRSSSREAAKRLPTLVRLGCQRDRGRETGIPEGGPPQPAVASPMEGKPTFRQVARSLVYTSASGEIYPAVPASVSDVIRPSGPADRKRLLLRKAYLSATIARRGRAGRCMLGHSAKKRSRLAGYRSSKTIGNSDVPGSPQNGGGEQRGFEHMGNHDGQFSASLSRWSITRNSTGPLYFSSLSPSRLTAATTAV